MLRNDLLLILTECVHFDVCIKSYKKTLVETIIALSKNKTICNIRVKVMEVLTIKNKKKQH